MLKNRAATWFVVSRVLFWAGLAAAESAEVSSVSPAPGQEEIRGVVIEEIPKDSALEQAGLQVGDVVLSWERLPNPPANPEAAQGYLASYFDWQYLEVEQAPRGTVVLCGQRGGKPLELTITPGFWEVTVRPVLPPGLETIHAEGKTYLEAGDLEKAVQAGKLLLQQADDGSRSDVRAWAAFRLGEIWGENGEWAKATEHFQEALRYARSTSAQVSILWILGIVEGGRNEYQAAEDAVGSALELCGQQSSESLCAAFGLNILGDLSFNRGDLNSAYAYLHAALRMRELLAPKSLPVAASLSNIGVVSWARGELDGADRYLNSARQLEEALAPQSVAVATTLNNLGTVAQARGDLNRAYNEYIQALRIYERLAPQSLDIAATLSNLGGVAWARGELGRAHGYLIRALDIERKLAPKSLGLAMSLNNLGNVELARDDLDGALRYHSESLRITEEVAPESLEHATSLSNLGATAWQRGELKEVRSYHLKALSIQEKLAPQSLDVAASLNYLGNLALASGELEQANDYHLRALRIEEQLAPKGYGVANNLRRLGRVAVNSGDLGLAYSYYTRALTTLEQQIAGFGAAYNVQAGFRSQRRDYYSDLFDLLFVQNRFSEAFQVLERFHAQTFLTMLVERDIAFTADIPEELDREQRRIRVLYDSALKRLAGLNPRDHAGEIEAIREELQKLDDQAGDVEARIRSASQKLAEFRHPQPLSLPAAQKVLDEGTLVLSFSVDGDRIALFVFSGKDDLRVVTLPVSEEALRTQLEQFLELLRETKHGTSITVLHKRRLELVSRMLYTTLLEPVADRIAASERLLILPDGPLHTLPFAALMHDTKEGPQYLAAWKPVHVALSATVFSELKERRHLASRQETLPVPLQLAAFGDPLYPRSLAASKNASTETILSSSGSNRGDPTVRGAADRGLFDFQPLPYTRREVLGIASLFPEGTAHTFLGPEALEEQIKSLNPTTDILHLAAHGSVDEHLPSSSFIALTIPEETLSGDFGSQRDNGLLQVWEIFERVRLNAELVVLSACDSGLGKELSGEGLIGLTRAFQYAGARSVLASLWKVNDLATSELMIRFYKHLRAGLPKDQALQAAQQELIRGPIEVTNEKGEREIRDFSAPYYWAGFQLYGDWQ